MRKGFICGISFLALLGVASVLAPACGNDPLPIDAMGPDIDASTVCMPGPKAFLEVCVDSTECATCLCQLAGHQKHCTQKCTGPAECPAPSSGCMGGVCQP